MARRIPRKPDHEAVRKHAARQLDALFTRLDRNRSIYADVNREFYPLGVAGWTKDAEDIADSELYDEEHRMLTTMPLICRSKGSSGFNANLTPPASPWFRLKSSANAEDNASHSRKSALDKVTEAAREIMSRSNTYKSLAKLYDHLLVNGFGCMLVTRDERYTVNVRTLRPGTYALGIGSDGIVNRCVRRFARWHQVPWRRFPGHGGHRACRGQARLRNARILQSLGQCLSNQRIRLASSRKMVKSRWKQDKDVAV